MAITVPVSAPKVYDAAGVAHYPEGASQTFKTGAFLKLDTNALVPAAADDLGLLIAAQDATGTTGAKIACYKITGNTTIEIGVNSTTGVTVGTSYGFVLSGTTALLDGTETTAVRLEVVETNLQPAGKMGVVGTDTNARVLARPLPGTADTYWVGV
jgi:hypothetical protein